MILSPLTIEAIIRIHHAEWSARMSAIPYFIEWLCEQLVRQLLWGVWLRLLTLEGEAQDRGFLRFCRLVNAAPCWPCRIDYQHPNFEKRQQLRGGGYRPGLCITTGQAADDMAWEDDFS
jgi:hypothetical protein